MGRRAKVLLIARIVASAGMLAILLPRLDFSNIWPRRELSSLSWATLALVGTLGGFILSSWRWQRVLGALELPSPIQPLVGHVFAGQFVSNFLPSTVGGDVLRVSRLSATNGQPAESFASVVLERLTGFLILPFLTLTALLGNPSLLRLGLATRLAVGLSIATLVALVVILSIVGSRRLGARLADKPRWTAPLRAVHDGLARMRRHPAEAGSVLLAALAYQITVLIAAWAAGHALGLELGWSAVMAFIPVVAIAQVLPISLNGIGLREGALVLLLSPLGIPHGQAVAFGLLLYGLNLLVSLAGLPSFAVGARRRAAGRAQALA